MAEAGLTVKCPLCEGHGELTRAEMAERFASPDLQKRLDKRISEILQSSELAGVGVGAQVRNFEKEVHEWNPQLPIWRRSPKE